ARPLRVSCPSRSGLPEDRDARREVPRRRSLRLLVSTVPGVSYARGHIPLRITFENTATEEIKMLRHFEPLPVFFSVEMTRADGTPIAIPGAGKISFAEGQIEYLVLRRKESFGFEVDLSTVIPPSAEVKRGDFTVSVTYHNQYGEGCFQGQLSSAPIRLTLGDDPDHPVCALPADG